MSIFKPFTWPSLIYFLFRLGAGGLVAAIISFSVSDYVVDRSTDDLAVAITALQGSIETSNASLTASISEMNTSLQGSLARLDISIRDNAAASDRLNDQMSEFREQLAVQTVRLAGLQDDMENVQVAVEQSGIDIKAGFEMRPTLGAMASRIDWSDFQAQYQIDSYPAVIIVPPQ